jgi:hypothetical protein
LTQHGGAIEGVPPQGCSTLFIESVKQQYPAN